MKAREEHNINHIEAFKFLQQKEYESTGCVSVSGPAPIVGGVITTE